MLERNGYPAGVPCWVDTSQPDPEAAVRFYRGLFGWEFEDRMPADSPRRYFMARLRDRDVAGVTSQDEPAPSTWNTYIRVDNADAAAAKVKAAGGNSLVGPFDVQDAGRMAVCSDPSGAVFCLWQAKERPGAQLVNEPGTWNFSELNTRDPEQGKAFYSGVFGWEADALDLGEGETTMWRLPGYGDFLEQSDPDLRRRMAEDGAPKGFEDVVAWLVPMTSDQYPDDVPAHWSITFAVDDTDAVADRAAELGGTVLAAPFDAPFVRMAVLSDPQGARFTVSRYQPDG